MAFAPAWPPGRDGPLSMPGGARGASAWALGRDARPGLSHDPAARPAANCASAFRQTVQGGVCRSTKLWQPFFPDISPRSEEHTSELQSRGHLVCRLLLDKKKVD